MVRGVLFFERHGCDTNRAVELTALALGLKDFQHDRIRKAYRDNEHKGLDSIDLMLEAATPELWTDFLTDDDGKVSHDGSGKPMHVDLFDQDPVPTNDSDFMDSRESGREYLTRLRLEHLIPYDRRNKRHALIDPPERNGYTLIDPPVSAYSSDEEIRAWITKLETMPESEDRDFAMEQAKQWLNR